MSNKKQSKINKIFVFIKKIFTHNVCDSCGWTKDDVYVTEYYIEAGFIQCEKCYNFKKLNNNEQQIKKNIVLKEKLQLELDYIHSKIDKLNNYINSDLYLLVNQQYKSLLHVQLTAMIKYRDCLKERIKTL